MLEPRGLVFLSQAQGTGPAALPEPVQLEAISHDLKSAEMGEGKAEDIFFLDRMWLGKGNCGKKARVSEFTPWKLHYGKRVAALLWALAPPPQNGTSHLLRARLARKHGRVGRGGTQIANE